MSRHINSEAFQMEQLRSSPSQQHLNPSRSSSVSQRDELDQDQTNERPHKLDLYSIPVFLLEVVVLVGLAYLAHFVHFQAKFEPLISGFYCDDISLRQHFIETKFIQQFTRPDNEIVVLALLLAVPIVTIIFCELVNSMFGSLKFRQIRALCTCCKLHSITRRTIRFSGAYALGFLILVISCDILANASGRFRPYFAQECPMLYNGCLVSSSSPSSSSDFTGMQARDFALQPTAQAQKADLSEQLVAPIQNHPPSQPISSNNTTAVIQTFTTEQPTSETTDSQATNSARFKRDNVDNRRLIERKWIDLNGANLSQYCNFVGDSVQTRKFDQIAMSWPSFPAAIFTYACLYIACYLSFVGTARPFRIITSVLVMVLLLIATIFDVQLVEQHYNHWEDVVAGAIFAFVVVIFVLIVYLNRFRDTHYYENQKIHKRRPTAYDGYRGFNNDVAIGNSSPDKTDGGGGNVQNGDIGGSVSNNDLAMRYFQIPRANYRGAPRPLSSLNQMRS